MSVARGTIAGMTPIDEPLLLETAAQYGVPAPGVRELMARARFPRCRTE
ncbi:hypothetical protein ACGFY9_11090 [Streptomyces sp. NPDC048504]